MLDQLLAQLAAGPVRTLKAPGGMLAARQLASSSSAVSGVGGAGLSTTLFPAASAGAAFLAAIAIGPFQGTISAHTPIGSRSVKSSPVLATGIVRPVMWLTAAP